MYGGPPEADNAAMVVPGSPFVEVKRRPDGREEAFPCSLLAYRGGVAVARYEFRSDFSWQGFALPRGGFTRAWYWRGRHYLLYRMYGRGGEHILDRFDVIDSVRLRRDGVAYRDLYLDVWAGPGGIAHIDDEDELAGALAAGLVTAAEAALAARTARYIVRNLARIIAGAERTPGAG